MVTYKIDRDTTALDVAFNVSGSLSGLPETLAQIKPTGLQHGFNDLPDLWGDTSDIGQTWTPDLDGVTLELDVRKINQNGDSPLNETAAAKAPFTTDKTGLAAAEAWGSDFIKQMAQ